MKSGWEEKKIGEIAYIEYGFTEKAKEKGAYRYVRITDIDNNGYLDQNDKVYIKFSEEAKKYLLKDDDLLMARTGASFGEVLLYKNFEKSVFASYLIRINFQINMINKLYWYFSKSKRYWDQANKLSSGSAQPQFNGSALKELYFCYPKSISEQKRIVAILDKAFAAIAKASENAENNLANARELFESYLQGVFANPGEGWEEKRLGDVAENLDSRRIPITKNVRTKGKIPYYGASGIVDYIADYIFNENLLLVSEDGANLLARTYPIAFSISGKTWVNNHAHVLRFKKIETQRLTEYYLNSISLDDYVSGMAQPKLNQAMLNFIPIPVPPLCDQKRIVAKLDALSAETIKLEAIYRQKLADLYELKKSLLHQAFSGEL